jgi:hypothetical protein
MSSRNHRRQLLQLVSVLCLAGAAVACGHQAGPSLASSTVVEASHTSTSTNKIQVIGVKALQIMKAFDAAVSGLVVPSGESARLHLSGIFCTASVQISGGLGAGRCRVAANLISSAPLTAQLPDGAPSTKVFAALYAVGIVTFIPNGTSSHDGGLRIRDLDCTDFNQTNGTQHAQCTIVQDQN